MCIKARMHTFERFVLRVRVFFAKACQLPAGMRGWILGVPRLVPSGLDRACSEIMFGVCDLSYALLRIHHTHWLFLPELYV